MKRPPGLLILATLSIWSCTKKRDVQCICHSNSQTNSYDLGIQKNPNLPANAAKCDTLGYHDNLDTCNLFVN